MLKALHRLKARMGRERNKAARLYGSTQSQRAYVEHYMTSILMSFIDDEIRKAKAQHPTPEAVK